MSKQTADLLGAYEALPSYEREEFFFDVLLRRTSTEVATDNALASAPALLVPVVAHAIAVFGDEDKASHWLATPLPAFGNRSPSEFLGEPGGIDFVEKILTRIEHNIPSRLDS
ncbi:MAG: MbcA/ParS/Xre antitoxin family protein [Bryobacteraceae bacterium]|nr:MbcA/ParS/Xre antitoxin family protein [Bryobacteraceae bacterium]